MLGALIGAAGSLLGGLLGGETKQKGRSRTRSTTASTSTTKNKVHLQQLVNAAERNGFNPLTLLRAGGLAAFTDSTTTGLSTGRSFTKSRGGSSSTAPLAAGIAGAASQIGGAIDNPSPSRASQSAADAWQAPLGASNAGAEQQLLTQQVGTQPRIPVSTTYSAKPALAAQAVTDGSDGSAMTPTYEKPTVTNPFSQGSGVKVDPTVPDAAAAEERYGDILSNAFGVYNIARDTWHAAANSDWAKEVINDYEKYRRQPITTIEGVPAIGLWDPPSIKMFTRAVVTHVPKGELSSPTGGVSGW